MIIFYCILAICHISDDIGTGWLGGGGEEGAGIGTAPRTMNRRMARPAEEVVRVTAWTELVPRALPIRSGCMHGARYALFGGGILAEAAEVF